MKRRSGHSFSSSGACEACQSVVTVYGRDSTPRYENRAFRQALLGHLLFECLGKEEAKQALRERLNEYDRGGRIESRG